MTCLSRVERGDRHGREKGASTPSSDGNCVPHSVGGGEPRKVCEHESDLTRAVLEEEEVAATC